MKILIADDHHLFRDGLKKIISERIPNVKFGEATNYGELIEQVAKSKWDVVILDLNMPGRSGFEALLELTQLKTNLKILIVSMYPENQFAARSIKAGALGYLTKGTTPEELITAIKTVANGELYFTSEVTKVVTKELRSEQKLKINSLSNREYQVFLMLARGESVSGIAKKFSLSPKTISTYKKRILEKLELESIADLTKLALQHNLIDK